MKIAVTSTGKNPDSDVDPRFGRAAYFIIAETETMDFSVIENDQTSGGAGIGAASLVIDAGAEAVLTGNCGPNAQQTLSAAGVTLYTGVSGKVTEAIELFKTGKLAPAKGPNVQSHFGMDK
jgi:predicted Fe-Mo cluster-binding NifX family protein